MHSMVGAFTPYTVKRRRVEIVRGYCYRFFQCSFPCGIVMLILSIIFIVLGTSQLIYIIQFNGCNTMTMPTIENSIDDDILTTPSSFKCNRQTMKVISITFLVTGSVMFLISLLIIKYSRLSEENNVIRTTTSSLLNNNNNNTNNNNKIAHNQLQQHYHLPPSQHHHPTSHHHNTSSTLTHDQNHVVVSIR